MITSLIFLNPEFTVRALFKFSSFGEHHESLISLREISYALILLAIHISMHLAFAVKAIVFRARRTTIVIQNLIKRKDSSTSWGWAPSCISLMLLDIILK